MQRKHYLTTALLFVIGITGIFGFNTALGMGWFSKNEVKEQLNYFRYDCGGGMLGGHKSVEVKRVDANYALVINSDTQWHHDIPKVSEYKVPAKVLEEIKTVFNAREMANWQKLPQSELQILDGDTSSYDFKFAKSRVRFSDTQKLPAKWWESTKEIFSKINQYCQQGEKFPGLVVPPRKEDTYMTVIEDGKVSLSLYCYRANSFSFQVNNGTDSTQIIKRSYIIKQLSPEAREIVNKTDEHDSQLAPNAIKKESIRLQERLAAGKYLLQYGDYSLEFEIR